MRIVLVRHAEAAPGDPDDLRPLTAHGRAQAREVGERLVRDGVDVAAVVSSPLLRARETAEAIARAVGADAEADERLAPGATAADVRAAASERGETVVVVGHQPDCSEVALALSGRDPGFPPAGVHVLDVD